MVGHPGNVRIVVVRGGGSSNTVHLPVAGNTLVEVRDVMEEGDCQMIVNECQVKNVLEPTMLVLRPDLSSRINSIEKEVSALLAKGWLLRKR